MTQIQRVLAQALQCDSSEPRSNITTFTSSVLRQTAPCHVSSLVVLGFGRCMGKQNAARQTAISPGMAGFSALLQQALMQLLLLLQ